MGVGSEERGWVRGGMRWVVEWSWRLWRKMWEW